MKRITKKCSLPTLASMSLLGVLFALTIIAAPKAYAQMATVGGNVYPMGHGLPFAYHHGLPITPIAMQPVSAYAFEPAVVYSSTPPAVPYQPMPGAGRVSVGPMVVVR